MTLLTPTVEIYIDSAWVDITAYVLVEAGVTIAQGRPDEQSGHAPSTCTFTVNNADGRFTPRNPTGPYYGFIGRNTPCRVQCESTDRWYGEISAWPQTWAPDENMAWVTVQGAGITRRLTQGPKPLAGPVRRWVSTASNISGYWPLEDPSTATSAESAISGVPAMFSPLGARPRYSADQTYPTSGRLPIMSKGSLQGLTGHTSGGLNAHMYLFYPEEDTDDGIILRFIDAGAYRWEVRYFTADNGSLILRAFDSGGSSLLTSTAITDVNSVPGILTLATLPSGGNTLYAMRFVNFETGVETAVTGSVADAGAQLGIVQVNTDLAGQRVVCGHLIVTLGSEQTTDVVDAMRGHTGETAGRRIERLCTEEGIPFDSIGDLDDTEPMGMQTSATFIDLVRQCEATDDGLLYEPPDDLALGYRTRESLYAQDPAATSQYNKTFTWFTPISDDQMTRNDVTVNRINGGSARYEVTTGPLSTQAPPDGVGRYDVSLNLSLDVDAQAAPIAEWHASKGTIDEPRYPDTTVNTFIKTGVDLSTIRPGDLVVITDPPVWSAYSDVHGLLTGWTETITPTAWRFALNLVPYAVYDALVLDDADRGRLDSDTTTLNEDLDTTETGVDYTGDDWITTASHPSEFPFDIEIGGEVITVTSAVAGTFTVTRSVNGIVKSHSSGAEIRLHRPNRIVL